MDILLTSFGLGLEERKRRSVFDRLPPINIDLGSNRFTFDYLPLLLFDRVIVDQSTYERTLHGPHEEWYHIWGKNDVLCENLKSYLNFLATLKSAGRLIVKDFVGLLNENKSTLDAAVQDDMKNISAWADPLMESCAIWEAFIRQEGDLCYADRRFKVEDETLFRELAKMADFTHIHSGSAYYASAHVDALRRWKKKQPQELRDETRNVLRDYLFYINLNIHLSRALDAPFLDWKDFQPFYDTKFRSEAHVWHNHQGHVDQSRQLFEVLFPFNVDFDRKKLLTAFEDKRIEQLRALVRDAVTGTAQFDSAFAVRTLHEVLKVESEAVFRRKLTGWITLPLGFIPVVGTVAQKGVEELLNRSWSERPKKQMDWFYLINEMTVNESHQYVQHARQNPLRWP